MNRFTTFDEDGFKGKNPVAALVDYLRTPGGLATAVRAIGVVAPAFNGILSAAADAIGDRAPHKDIDVSTIRDEILVQLIEAIKEQRP